MQLLLIEEEPLLIEEEALLLEEALILVDLVLIVEIAGHPHQDHLQEVQAEHLHQEVLQDHHLQAEEHLAEVHHLEEEIKNRK